MEAMKAAGFGPGSRGRGARTDIGAFIELHIEQGAILEQEGQTIGIVEQIVGLQALHRPRERRGEPCGDDADVVPQGMRCGRPARWCAAVMDGADQIGAPLVATVGR
ncbi:hypothetical protein VQ056_26210 [Paenibacillus sp. JTLBN-2024]